MKERPILFSGPMVRAILAGRKTQTRRLMKQAPSAYVPGPNRHATTRRAPYFDAYCGERKTDANPRGQSDRWCWWSPDNRQGPDWIRCPYGASGARLWVRETWAWPGEEAVVYRADTDAVARLEEVLGFRITWRPSIFMRREHSRIVLEITDVRVERLQDISDADARAEGVEPAPFCKTGRKPGMEHVEAFETLWDTINGKRAPWSENPWVWALTFKVVTP